MNIRAMIAILAIAFCLSVPVYANSVEQLAATATSEDTAAATNAVRELRAMGPVGLDALFTRYATEIEHFTRTGESNDEWRRIADAIDTVAMQKDAYASHLYWYTDLDEAQRAAKAKHKPVLTLRLLGNLNEEFSCANSRLFRALLYPNADIGKYLRDNYVLHWRSVRPAPRITIDFGDGRKIERTITGNSIHYILDSDGEIIDALPGLYSPVAFLKYIKHGNEMNAALKPLSNARHALALMKYRKASYDAIIQKRKAAVASAKVELTEPKPGTLAREAAPLAMVKMIVTDEYSVLRVYDDFAKFDPQMNFGDWGKLAQLYSPNVRLDEASIAFVRRQNAKTGLSEDEFKKLFAKLDTFVRLDTTRNDFLFHTKLYAWLNEARGLTDPLELFNSRVYEQIFQTPAYDKWLGLYSSDVYTALDGNGIIK